MKKRLFFLVVLCLTILGITNRTSAQIVTADRLRSNDTGANGQFWERTEDSQNSIRWVYGPLSPNGLVDINNSMFNRYRITGRGSAIWVGRTDLGPDVALPTGSGGRMMWSVVKRAFRAGFATGNEWDDVNVGQYSFATGIGTRASGESSVATGTNSIASGPYSTAMGSFSVSSGPYSTAIGLEAKALGESSVAIGYGVIATNLRSFVIGAPLSSERELINTIPNSLVVGFVSDLPTLFVGPAPNYDSTGNVGIGTTNTAGFKLYVNGNVAATSFAQISDIRLKTNVSVINNSLTKILSLEGIKYQWNKAIDPKREFSEDTQLGFSAQEVEKVLPEAVSTSTDGYKAVSYQSITPVIVEAMKEQQQIINQQKQEIENLKTQYKTEIDELRMQLKAIMQKLENRDNK